MGRQVVLVDQRLPSDQFILAGVDTSRSPQGEADPKKIPVFSVSELGKIFFARSAHWVRWLEGSPDKPVENKMQLDGKRLIDRRTPKGARIYTLGDVEAIAHGLAQQGVITGAQMTNALIIVQAMARQWGYIA